jgi:hypothetical protein
VGLLVICVFVFTVFCIVGAVFFILFRLCVFFYLFGLYWCKDYCHRVRTQLQLAVVVVAVAVVVIYCIILL